MSNYTAEAQIPASFPTENGNLTPGQTDGQRLRAQNWAGDAGLGQLATLGPWKTQQSSPSVPSCKDPHYLTREGAGPLT